MTVSLGRPSVSLLSTGEDVIPAADRTARALGSPAGARPFPGGPALGSGPPSVSVVVTDYGRRQFIRDAIHSVLSQSLRREQFEVIVVKDYDDAEIDSYLTVNGVRTITNDTFRVGTMLAEGVEEARGEIVCFLDDDDRFKPQKLARVVARFRADPHLGLIRNAYEPIDVLGKHLASWYRFRPQPTQSVTIAGSEDGAGLLPWIFRFGAYTNMSTYSVRREMLRRWLPELRQLSTAQDLFLLVIASLSGYSQQLDPSVWNEFRVHASTSHPAIAQQPADTEIQNLSGSVGTAGRLLEMLRSADHGGLAYRLTKSFELDAKVARFLLDPREKLELIDWITFSRVVAWCRRPYLAMEWLWCVPRWLFPSWASRLYCARRRSDIRRCVRPSGPT